MNPWIDLYRIQQGARTVGDDVSAAIRSRLIKLADGGHCADTIRGRFTYRATAGKAREWYIRTEGDVGTESVTLPDLREATLSVQLTTDTKGKHIHEFSAAVSGLTRADARWTVAIHLEDDRGVSNKKPHPEQKGDGACSHAVMHCHVGPDLDAFPKVRLPMPAMGPADALDWLLATVVPGFEPMPWPDLNACLFNDKS